MNPLQIFEQPDQNPAYSFRGKTGDYASIKNDLKKVLNYLSRFKKENMKLALQFEFRPWMDLFFLAGQIQGHCLIPLSNRWGEAQRQRVLMSTRPDHIITDFEMNEILKGPSVNLGSSVVKIPGDHLFSLMNTSGSTGISKIVGIEFSSWHSFMTTLLKYYPLWPGEKVAQSFDPAFDPYWAMTALSYTQGAHLFHLDSTDTLKVFDFCEMNQIEFWSSVPSLVDLSLKRGAPGKINLKLKRSIFTGEKLRAELAVKWHQWAPLSTLENLYGPVETCVWVTRAVLAPDKLQDPLPIGFPFEGQDLSLENEELVIRGSQVARGYFENDNWNLFRGVYRTGDRVECLPSGEFCWLGRMDNQIKVAGQRVDLDELERVIEKHLHASCLLVWDETTMTFSALIDVEINQSRLFNNLKADLPTTHIPKHWFVVDSLPRLPNGKRDRSRAQKIAEQRIRELSLKKDG